MEAAAICAHHRCASYNNIGKQSYWLHSLDVSLTTSAIKDNMLGGCNADDTSSDTSSINPQQAAQRTKHPGTWLFAFYVYTYIRWLADWIQRNIWNDEGRKEEGHFCKHFTDLPYFAAPSSLTHQSTKWMKCEAFSQWQWWATCVAAHNLIIIGVTGISHIWWLAGGTGKHCANEVCQQVWMKESPPLTVFFFRKLQQQPKYLNNDCIWLDAATVWLAGLHPAICVFAEMKRTPVSLSSHSHYGRY